MKPPKLNGARSDEHGAARATQRERQPLAGKLERIFITHCAIRGDDSRRAPHAKIVRPQLFTHGSLRRIELKRQRPKRFVPSPVHDAVRQDGRTIDSRVSHAI